MKKLFLAFAIMLFSFGAQANNFSDAIVKEAASLNAAKESITITLQVKEKESEQTITLAFDNAKDVEQFDFTSLLPPDESCMVTATVTVSVKVSAGMAGVASGEVTTTVSASVTASCDTIAAAVKALTKSLKDSIK